jgi:hypothetical protein
MVACGHTLGGVRGKTCPEITGDSSHNISTHFDIITGEARVMDPDSVRRCRETCCDGDSNSKLHLDTAQTW